MLSPVPQILLKGSRTPPGFLTRRRSLDVVRTQTRTPPPAAVTPRFANFRDRTLGGVTLGRWKLSKAGATCGRGARVGPRDPGWLQWGPCAAPSDAPSSGHCPCGGSCSSGNCWHPGPGSGARVTPLLLQHPGPDGKTLLKFAARTFSPGAQNCADTGLLSRVSISESEPRLPRAALSWDAALEAKSSLWDRFYFLAGIR